MADIAIPNHDPADTSRKVFTLGHGNRSLGDMIHMLRKIGIDDLVDVRSQPRSGRFTWFDKLPLDQALREKDIAYVFEVAKPSERWVRPRPPTGFIRPCRMAFAPLRRTWRRLHSGLACTGCWISPAAAPGFWSVSGWS